MILSKTAQEQKVLTSQVFGVAVSQMTMQQTVDYLMDAVKHRVTQQIITAGPIMFMTAFDRPDYMKMMQQADLVVPDGAGLVWAARYLDKPVAERVAGYDLMHQLFQAGEHYQCKIYLLGSTPEIISQAATNLGKMYPNNRIVGYHDGFFDETRDPEIVAAIKDADPDMLFVARSVDNQDVWIGRYRDELGVPIMMGVGGSFDIIAGKLKRAPSLFRKLRLEWLYRLLQEPNRAKRMLLLPKFVIKTIRYRSKARKDG